MSVISFESTEGGAGRTTSAVVFATTLAARHEKVELIDADPSGRLVS